RPGGRTNNAHRTPLAETIARRVATTLERPTRRHEHRRASTDASLPGREVHVASAPPPRGEAGDHRLGPDSRPRGPPLGRADRARRLVRRTPNAVARPAHPRP